jgi:class 3 adenylate cyclase
MCAETNTNNLRPEIAHVLLVDVVGYSKLLIEDQREVLHDLNAIVRNTEQFRAAESAGKLIRLPTGDGIALAFFMTPDAPVRCAVEIARALKNRPDIQLRMGIHSGPVSTVADVNDSSNLAGAGINLAQRVMDCGDAGHILLSKHTAEDLEHYRDWQPLLHDLDAVEVKHGVHLSLVNLYDNEIGNPAPPTKCKTLSAGAPCAGLDTSCSQSSF